MDKEIADLYNTKDILSKYNIRLNKNLGQHFLVSNVVLNKIIKASDLKGNEKVIEIGAGIGSLTQYLLKELEKGELIAIEKDTRFITILSDFFNNYDNLIILKLVFFVKFINEFLTVPKNNLSIRCIWRYFELGKV